VRLCWVAFDESDNVGMVEVVKQFRLLDDLRNVKDMHAFNVNHLHNKEHAVTLS
jgi:hypothetical protein